MNKTLVTILFVSLLFLPLLSHAQEDGEPGVNEFVFVESEAEVVNMSTVKSAIGYPEAARKEGLTGTVVLRVLVDEEGNYVRHTIIKSAGVNLDTAVAAHASELSFLPAYQEGKAVKFWVNVPFVFRLVEDQEANTRALIAVLDSLLEQNPEDFKVYLRRGLAYRDLGEASLAISDFTLSIDLNPRKSKKKNDSYPDLFYAYYARGSTQSLLDRQEEARRDLSLAISNYEEIRAPDSALHDLLASAYLDRGYLSLQRGTYDIAKSDFEWVLLNATEKSCEVYSMLADVGTGTDDFLLVVEAIDGQISCSEDNLLLYYSRGYYKGLAESYPSALVDFDTVIVQTDLPQLKLAAYNRKGWTLWKMGKPDEGREMIEKALALNVINPLSYYYLGLIALDGGEIDEACNKLGRALSYGLDGIDGKDARNKGRENCPESGD